MREDTMDEAKSKQLEGIDGWLIWPALYLVAVPLFCLGDLIDSPLPRLRPEVLGGNVALVVASVVMLVLFYQKRSVVPALMVGYYVMVAAVAGLEYAVLALPAENVGAAVVAAHIDEARGALEYTGATAIVWIPYFLVSKRVHNTFVAG